jgi:hypothetical protein
MAPAGSRYPRMGLGDSQRSLGNVMSDNVRIYRVGQLEIRHSVGRQL